MLSSGLIHIMLVLLFSALIGAVVFVAAWCLSKIMLRTVPPRTRKRNHKDLSHTEHSNVE